LVVLGIHSGFMLRYTRDKCRVEGPGGRSKYGRFRLQVWILALRGVPGTLGSPETLRGPGTFGDLWISLGRRGPLGPGAQWSPAVPWCPGDNRGLKDPKGPGTPGTYVGAPGPRDPWKPQTLQGAQGPVGAH
jgi:hypothetical protein